MMIYYRLSDIVMKKYLIEFTEEQLMLLAKCTEDIHRFVAGDHELHNTLSSFPVEYEDEVEEKLKELQGLLNPRLSLCERYSYNGHNAPSKEQEMLIANTYQCYREIYHIVAEANNNKNVYSSSTLRAGNIGQPKLIEVK